MPHRLLPLAQSLRSHATSAERQLWSALRREQIEGFKFRRQVAFEDCIVDFASFDARLVIEVDGATYSSEEEAARDVRRDRAMAARGFSVLRFQNEEIYRNLDGVVETIRFKLLELRPREHEQTLKGQRDPPP